MTTLGLAVISSLILWSLFTIMDFRDTIRSCLYRYWDEIFWRIHRFNLKRYAKRVGFDLQYLDQQQWAVAKYQFMMLRVNERRSPRHARAWAEQGIYEVPRVNLPRLDSVPVITTSPAPVSNPSVEIVVGPPGDRRIEFSL